MAGKAYVKQSGVWVRIPKLYIKSGGFWTSLQKAYIKISGAWVKVFDSTSQAPQLDTTVADFRPQIRYLNFRINSPNAGVTPVNAGEPIIMGPGSQWGAGDPTSTNTGIEGGRIKYLYCFDGYWINDAGASEIRSIQANTTTDTNTWTTVGEGEESVVNGGKDLLANTYNKIRWWDNYYIWYYIRKTITGVGSTLELDGPLKVIRQAPTINTFTMADAANLSQGTPKSVTFNLADQWYKSVDKTISFIEWFETTGATDALTVSNRVSGPTLLSSLTTTPNGGVADSTSLTGTTFYTPTTIGKYLAAQITYKNSNSTYFGLTPTSIVRSTATVSGPRPVGTAGTVTYTRDPASYTYTVSNSGTWTNTPTSYRYQWYLESQTTGSSYTYSPITGATSSTYNASVYAPSGTTSYKIVPVVWATNSNGESTFGFGLINSSDQNITSTAGGIAGTPVTVFYREPSITTFTVTGGVNNFTYVSNYSVYDPANTAVISWTGTGTGSLNVTSSAATQTSTFLAAGTYNFTLTVTNAGSYGNSYNKVATQSSKTITAPAVYSFTFGTGNPLYVGTNGHIHFDAGQTGSTPSTGKSLAIYLADLYQGQPTADTIGLKYWSDASNYVIQFKGYRYVSPQTYTAADALDYQVKFNTANAYADVSIIRKGGSVLQPTYAPGMYIDSQKWISGVNGLPTYTVPTDLTDEGDTANAYTYRLNFNGTQGSLNIIPWSDRASGKQYRIPDSLMISAQAINSTNNTALTTSGSLDDGWTKLTPLANQYNLSTITAGTATATSSSLSIPFTTGGADYSTYSYVLRSGSHSGTVVASANGQTANPIIISSGLSASTTYYLTLTPTNSMAQNGNANLTTHVTSARNKAAGTKKIIPLGITVTSGSTIAYVSTNGYIGLNSDPSSSVSIPITGRYLNLLAGDLRQTALYTTATSTTYSIRYKGAWYNDPSQTVDYEIKFTFGSTAAEAYIITNNLTTSPSDSVLFVDNVSSNTWSTLNNSTMTATAVTRTGELQDNADDARTQISLTATSLNLTTTPAYGSATSAPTGWSASITTAASPSGGTYSLVSTTAGTASVNSSNGAVTVSGLTAGQSSTVTTRYSLSGYNSVDITKAGSASAAVAEPTNSSPPTLSVSPSLNVGGTFTFTAGTWTGSPTSYALYLYRGTASVATSETVASGPLNAQSGTYIIPLSDFNDANNRKYYRAFASATNAGGTSSSGALTPGQELGPITNTVTLKPPNVPTGLTTPSGGTSPNLIFNSSSWTAPVVDATHNAATHYQVYFEASTSATGTYVAAANTFTYTNNQFGSTVATNANTPLTAKAVYNTSVSTGRVTASTGSYTWVKMWVRAVNADGPSDWVSKTG